MLPLRLRRRAAKDFDRRRIDVVGGTVRAPPLLMSPKVAIDRTAAEHDQPDVQSVAPREPDVGGVKIVNPALDEFDDLPPDFDDVDLDEAVPVRPVSAGPKAKESVKKVRLRGFYSPPPPPPVKKLTFPVRRSPPPPATLSGHPR
jgi:hypothetical protein